MTTAEMWGAIVCLLVIVAGWFLMAAWDRYVQQQRQARVYEQLRYEVESQWLRDDIAAFEAGERP